MNFPRHHLWSKGASIDEEADELLGHDLTGVKPRDRVVKTATLFPVYVLLLHVIVLALSLRQLRFIPRATNSYLVGSTSWCT